MIFCFELVLRGWLTRKRYARLKEVHHLQVTFIRKFSDDITMKSQFYRTQIDHQCQYDYQRIKTKIDEDEEQIEKTLNLFDAMLDSYLIDQETMTKPVEKVNINTNQLNKHEFDVRSFEFH